MKHEDVLLFEPTKRDMKIEYPELAEYDEFKKISKRELRFCWLVGNRTSPISEYPAAKRIKAAAKIAWGDYSLEKEETKEMLDGKLPKHLKPAIELMSSFSPSLRLRAKFMQEYVFDKMQSVLIITNEEMGDMDADSIKKYAELSMNISSKLPQMVNDMESGFGVKVKEDSKGKAEAKRGISDLIDKVN